MGNGQEALARIDRLFATLRQLRHEMSAREGERDLALFARACRLAVDYGECRLAWIGVVDRARSLVVPVAHAGAGGDYLDGLETSMDEAPTGTAVRERRGVFCTDIATAGDLAPWRERALAHGLRSAGAFPIERGEDVCAALTLYSGATGFAEPVERAIAEALATELGVALDAADREAARREAETRLRASEERCRSIIESAGDGIVLASAERRFLEANPAACALFGYSRDELLSMPIEEVIAPEDLATHPIDLTRVGSAVSFTVERRLLRKDGRRLDAEIKSIRLPDGRVQSIVRDVTARKRAQAEQAANERVLSLGRLAQSVGHEINNPLAYLTLSLEQVRAHAATLSAERRQGCELALSAADDGVSRIAHIVRALSAFGRGDTEATGPVSLPRVVGAALTLTRNRVQHVGAVDVSLGDTPPVRANEFGLTQVLVNLLLNAADAMEGLERAGHAVTVSSGVARGGRVVVEISDTGPGIRQEELERIFDPFYTTKPIGKGTGVGLSISRAIVASFAGTLEVENRDGGGATFRLSLVAASAPAPASDAGRPMASSQRRRVLVVDDEALVARAVALALHGHDVEVRASVDEALEACMREDFDCILCDLMMPTGSGRELYEMLGQLRPSLVERIVFMTGGAFTDAADNFLRSVPNRCITKPFTADALLDAVERAPRRGGR